MLVSPVPRFPIPAKWLQLFRSRARGQGNSCGDPVCRLFRWLHPSRQQWSNGQTTWCYHHKREARKKRLTWSQWLEQVNTHTAPKWWFNGDEAHVCNHVWTSRGISWIMHHHAIMHPHYHVYSQHVHVLDVLLHHQLGHLCKTEAHYATRQSAGGPCLVELWSCVAVQEGIITSWTAKWHSTPMCLERKLVLRYPLFLGAVVSCYQNRSHTLIGVWNLMTSQWEWRCFFVELRSHNSLGLSWR